MIRGLSVAFIASRIATIALIFGAIGCGVQSSVSQTYTDSGANILNPERGWWFTVQPDWRTNDTHPALTEGYLRKIKQHNGVTVVRKYYVIDDYLTAAIPRSSSDPHAVTLDMVEQDFDAVRAAGMKLIPRFVYVHNTGLNDKDATEARIKAHIDQVSPIWRDDADVLLYLQAGFVGYWGEWHDSWHGHVRASQRDHLPLSDSGKRIMRYLMDSLPQDRMLAVRYPSQAMQAFGSSNLVSSEAYSGTDRSRLGFANDCVAYSVIDRGTYSSGVEVRKRERAYMRSFAQYNVMDGEPCGDKETYPYPQDNFMSEVEHFGYQALNMNQADPDTDSFYAWLRNSGNFDTVARKLGYRYDLNSATAPASVDAGEGLSLDLDIENDGWGRPFNARPIALMLRNVATGEEHKAHSGSDARLALPDGGAQSNVTLNFAIPSSVPTGNYRLLLSLPDPYPSLASNPNYSVRLATAGLWEPSTGLNDLGLTIGVNGE